MPLEEYQFYIRLYNNKQNEEGLQAQKSQNEAKAKFLSREPNPVGENLPRGS